MLGNNWLALLVTFFLALAWLRLNDFIAQRGWTSSALSRKFIHIGTGPIFVACWLLFENTPSARYMAALVPLAFTVQFFLIGTGILQDSAAVQAMSRSGDRREILQGPLYYGIIHVLVTILYWYDTPVGIVALMLLCGGDGLADILGRRLGHSRLPWNKEKSWAGSFGMFAGGWFFSILIMAVYVTSSIFSAPLTGYLLPLGLIALVGTAVESLPYHDIDNISVTLAALLAGRLLL